MPATPAPYRLRFDHLKEPLGVGPEAPRFSWWLTPGTVQHGYELESIVGEETWSSKPIEGSDSVLVAYDGPRPAPGERALWRVRIRTGDEWSHWSEWAWWEPALASEHWSARWIVPADPDAGEAGSRATHLLRTVFDLETPAKRARLHITAHGIYEAHLDGVRVGDAELTPGFTEYSHRTQVQVYDVTDALSAGTHELTVELSDGWYRGQVGVFRYHEQWGARTALLAQLVVELPDDTVRVIATDDTWRSATTTHLADLIAGETIDARFRAGAVDWSAVTVEDRGYSMLVASPAPPVRQIEELAPVSVTRRGSFHVVDFGQNFSGWLRLRDLGAADARLTLTFGEELGPDGDVTQVNLEPAIPFLPERLAAGQVDHLVSDGDPTRVIETRHSTHGFRYVRIEGLDHEPAEGDLVGVVVHTDLEPTGTFECSDDDLNRLHAAAVWSFRGNAVDVPTDCPVRERAAWTGDWQIFAPTATYLYDVAGFGIKWLRDLAVGQRDTGLILNQAPMPHSEFDTPPGSFLNGSAGWGDAAVIVPWQLYQSYADPRILEEFYPVAERWMAFVTRAAESDRHPSRAAAHPQARPHDAYLWDTGFHWGEWLEPNPLADDGFEALLAADKGAVATAYYRHSTRLMGRMARALGRDDDAQHYEQLSERVRDAWCTEFLTRDGRVEPATQATCVRALVFDLVPERVRAGVAAQLVELIRAADGHLGTGFLSTGLLLPALADAGYPDVAFEVLQQRTEPSWLAMLDRGATTMWERWQGWTDDGQPSESHNHYSKGAVVTFLHRYVVGIRPVEQSPGYARFDLHPVVGGGLTSARGSLATPHGIIESAWHIVDGRFVIDFTVPPGTRCRLTLPDGTTHGVLPGVHRFSSRLP
jgi:alpha-L-rhamnosidase